jgi:UDP-2,3-diacylglucosamine pyrophosphatase LpxH
MNDAIIISDLHLGSDVCQSKKINQFFIEIEKENIETKEIIVNGDLFDSWDFRKLKSSHWKVLSHLRKLSKTKHIVWINGNHDGPAEAISHLIGLDFVEEYEFVSGTKKILVLHGDRFDNFIAKYPLLTRIADQAYRFIQRIDSSFYLAKLAKRSSKTFLRCSEQIKNKAIEYGASRDANIVICGHTHLASISETYCNSGCWTESPCHYLTVHDGTVKLHCY